MESITAKTLQDIRRATDHALDLAAKVTLAKFRQPIAVDNKDSVGFDPVTVADREAEQVLRDTLMSALPHANFLGEEDSVAGSGATSSVHIDLDPATQNQLTWVVDPIDGTRAFITGLPLWGTLIGLNDGEKVLFGAFDQPWLRERFIGDGSRSERVFNGESNALKTREARALNECILQTTTPDMFTNPQTQAAFSRASSHVAMTRYGGDCYAYALLCMGGIDAVVESSLQPYDIQAIIPIVEGAGGVITNWEGKSCLEGGNVIAAANATVHEQLLDVMEYDQT